MKKYLNTIWALVILLIFNHSVFANNQSKTEKIIDASLVTLNNFSMDPEMIAFQEKMQDAKGFLIIPGYIKAGFGLGGAGGTGVLLRKNSNNEQTEIADMEQWSFPAFYSMGSITLGLQIGAEVAEVILVFMNSKGMDAMLTNKLQLGADASIAAGPVGTGTQIATADIILYSRGKGAFGGLTVEGALISARDSLNQAYYGVAVSPLEIMVTGQVDNFQANPLREKLSTLTNRSTNNF